MPIYHYECPKCGAKFELIRSVDGRDDYAGCPECCEEARRVEMPKDGRCVRRVK